MGLQESNKNITLVGFGALPVAGDVIGVSDYVLINPKVATGAINAIGTGALANSRGYVDGNNIIAEFDIKAPLRSPVSLGTAPELAKLLKMAGLAEVLTVGTSAVYKLGGVTSGNGQVKGFVDGFSRTVTGAVCNIKIAGKVGEPVTVTASVKGGLATAVSTAEANPVTTLNTGVAIMMSKNDTITINGVVVNCSDFELDLAATIERSYTTGTNEYYISNFKPTLTVTAIKTKTTDEAAWTDLMSGGTKVISLVLDSAGNQLAIDAAAAFCSDISESDDKGRISMKRVFTLENGGTANNNFTLTLK
ncbi:MAG: hypothetical protein PHV62_08350 [Sulfuricurvum sp.]|nr:hypothetical protein [Sulfuricurvum sp.]